MQRTPLYHRPVFWFLAALLVRLPYLIEQASTSPLFNQLLLDEAELADTARAILNGWGFGPEPLFKAPLYPVFLAGVMWITSGAWLWAVRLIQHVCGALLAVMAFDVARRLTSGPGQRRGQWAGMLAAGAVVFCGPLIRLENQILLDFLAVFLQSAMLWALVRMRTTPRVGRATRWATLAGLLAMLSWLNRPTIMPVLPFLVWWAASPLRRSFPSLLHPINWKIPRAVLCAALFLLPPAAGMYAVGIRNMRIERKFVIMPWQGGYNFYQANRIGTSGRYLKQEGFSLAPSGNPTREIMVRGFLDARDRGEWPRAKASDGRETNAYWYDRAKKEIRRAPLKWLGLMSRKILYLFSEREIFNIEDYHFQKSLSTVLQCAPVGFGFMWPFALASLAALRFVPRGRRRLHALMWLYFVLLGGAIALFYTSGRFRMPLVFPAVVLGASGLALFMEKVKTTRILKTTGLLYGMLLVCGVTMSWTDWWGVRSENVRQFECARLSNAYWRSGNPEKALEYAERCERESPGYPSAPLLRGQALYSLGRYEEAEREFRQSERALPEDPIAPYNLGILCYYHFNRPEEAAACFEESLKRQPEYHRARWMAARANVRLGGTDKARKLLESQMTASGPRLLENNRLVLSEDLMISYVVLCLREGNASAAQNTAKELAAHFGDAGLKRLNAELKILGLDEMKP